MWTRILLGGCLLAAGLLLALVFRAWLYLPLRQEDLHSVLPASGDGGGLEQSCRAYLFLRRLGIFRQPLWILDLGLNETGADLARRLVRLDPEIRLCKADSFLQQLENEGSDNTG